MAVERPERETITVNVGTVGTTARQFGALEGLKDWAGIENANLHFGACGAFHYAAGLTRRETDALKAAWREVKAIDNVTAHYADALRMAAKDYGETDRHSAAAVAKAAGVMNEPPKPNQK